MVFRRSASRRSIASKYRRRGKNSAPNRSVLRFESLESRLLLAGDLYVDLVTPVGAASNPFETLEVEFSKPVDESTLSVEDFSISGTGTPSMDSVTSVGGNVYQLSLSGTGLDTYSLTVGPEILDTDGAGMNQDRDATAGEATDDAFVATLSSAALTINDGDSTYDDSALVLYGSAATVEGDHAFSQVLVTAGGQLTIHGSLLETGDLTLEETSSAELAGGSQLDSSDTILITGNSTLVVAGANVDAQVDSQWAGVGGTISAQDLTVDAGSTITADGEGYLGGQSNNAGRGPGAATTANNVGATYGGTGGDGQWGDPVTETYGNALTPTDLGSGGGGYDGLGGGQGGDGGGAIRLDVSGTLTLNGEISADGESVNTGRGEGGGSGGSIYVTTQTLTGSGLFTADGGSSLTSRGGGGAGGRIAVYYADGAGFSGTGSSTANGGTGFQAGGTGTVAFLDTSSGAPDLAVDQNLVLAEGETYTFGDITVRNGATLTLGGGATLNATGTLHVLENSQIVVQAIHTSGQVDGQWVGEGSTINAVDVTIEAGSIITADSQGYEGGQSNGVGQGPGTSTSSNNAGATYSALGGDGNWGDPEVTTYGDALAPTDLGSGGGGYDGLGAGQGGDGGGAIRLAVSGTLTLDGEISADGQSIGTGRGEGGGSGGSIYVTAGTLDGTGTFTADGGSSLTSRGGGGSGGRVVVYYVDDNGFSGFASSTATGGSGLENGSDGSVGFFDVTDLANHLTDANRDLFVFQTYRYDTEDSDLAVNRVVVGDASAAGALFAVGGGVTLSVNDSVHVTNNSVLLAQATDRLAAADGEWIGEGIHLVAQTVTVDAGSAISADGQGYLATCGPSPGGSASYGSAGGAHAGAGGHGAAGAAAQTSTYGSSVYPVTLGSGGGNSNDGGAGGGAIWLEVGETLTVNGSLSADGAKATGRAGGGAGGSLFVSATTITGSGTISADGGDFGDVYGGGGGAGHLVVNVGDLSGTLAISADGGAAVGGGGGGGGGSLYAYPWNSMSVPVENLTASGGVGSQATGSDGEVVIEDEPFFQWLDESGTLFHDSETLAWQGLGFDPSAVSVTLVAASDTNVFTIGSGLPYTDSFDWDTTTVADGRYEVRAVFRSNGAVLEELTREVLVNNSVQWHTGSVSQDQTWAADTVHVVEGDLSIESGTTVTVEEGAVVKLASGAEITVQDGGSLDAAAATDSLSIVFTSLADDSVGGDTNLDGTSSVPLPGSWNGVTPVGSGQFLTSAYTSLRYAVAEHSGALTSDEVWLGTFLHRIVDYVTVPDGVSLTIEPGAVVKFDTLKELTIQGTLDAQGSVAQPITFTSIRDDSVAGDSNGDGNTTAPSAGDWRWIYVDGGTATLDHTAILYGGGTTSGEWDSTGVLRTNGDADLTLSNSIVRDVFFDGVLNWGGTTTIENSILTNIDRAITSHVGSDVTVTNCTLDNNRIGLLAHGGAMAVQNTVVVNSLEYGVLHDMGDAPTFSYTDVWAAADSGSVNYEGVADPTGTDGNLSVDPQFRNRTQGDYRLDFGSPLIDAADGTYASTVDRMGSPRYDDPRTVNTGVVMPGGTAVPDIGALEFAEAAESDIDLVVSSICGPVDAVAGDQVTVSWTVTNVGSGTAVGPWHDAVYLVDSLDEEGTGTFVTETLVGPGVTLGPGESLEVSATVRVPGGTVGNHYWQVKTNWQGEVFEGQNTANNLQTSGMPVALDLPELTIDGSGLIRTFSEVGESHWFKFTPTAGQDILVSLNLAGDVGTTELYVARGSVPTRLDFEAKSSQWQSADTTVLRADTTAQTYYVMAYADSLSGGAANFTITAEALAFSLSSASPDEIGNTGNVTLKLEGGQLADDLTYQIVDSEDTATVASSVYVVDSGTVYATFDTTGLPVGTYDVEVVKGGQTVALTDVIDVVAGNPAELEIHLSVPEATRPGWVNSLVIDYKNVGNVDMVAPLILLEGPGAEIGWPGESETSSTMLLLGISPEGPAGILSPGQSGSIELEMTVGVDVTSVDFTISTIGDETTTFDWDLSKDDYAPDVVSEADASQEMSLSSTASSTTAWDAWYAAFTDGMGDTAGSVQAALAESATRLGQMGIQTTDGHQLLDFRMLAANPLGDMLRRSEDGALGYGWPDITDFSAEADEDGNVTVALAGEERYFVKQTNGSFEAQAGETGKLALVGGVYRLTEHDGANIVFRADGTLNYIEDSNGNRVTATYTQGRLTALAMPDGTSATFEYSSDGHLTAMTDADGNQATYSYDANGNLASMTTPLGFTLTYTYYSGGVLDHALASVDSDAGGLVTIEYDEYGRISSRTDTGATMLISYDSTGGQTTVDATGKSITVWRDDQGQVTYLSTNTSQTYHYQRDSEGRLVAETGPLGTRTTYSYDLQGNLASIVDALGGQTSYTYESTYNQLTSARTPTDELTQYINDANGNLTEIRYADGTTSEFTYDSQGRLVRQVNAQGEAVDYTYVGNTDLVASKSYTGYNASYTYDDAGNMLTATDPNGTTTMTWGSFGQLTRIDYPSGRWIEYDYDQFGRRIRSTDQAAAEINYHFDSNGRLTRLSDANDDTIVAYSYDVAGRLIRKDQGNGTFTEYTYDLDSNVQCVHHQTSAGATISRYEYTYDALGRQTSMTNAEGRYDYTYDLLGRLTSVTTPSGREIAYEYDADGNRLAVTDEGTTDDYSVGVGGRYDSAGNATYTYDADGNTLSKTEGESTWNYTYDTEGRLAGWTGPDGTWSYEYDALGNRVAVVHDSQRTELIVDPLGEGALFAEYNADGSLKSRYAIGLEDLVAAFDGTGEAVYYNFDAAGNTVQITDAAGSVANSYSYLPFGEITSQSETVDNRYTFAGQFGVAAVGNGQYFANVRQYDAELGRFMSQDWLNVPGQNAYTYAGNQPTGQYDSNGFVFSEVVENFVEPTGNNVGLIGNTTQIVGIVTEMGGDKVIVSGLKNTTVTSRIVAGTGTQIVAGGKTMQSFSEALGPIGTTLQGLSTANTLYKYSKGEADGLDVSKSLAYMCADGLQYTGYPPAVVLSKVLPAIDMGSEWAFGKVHGFVPQPSNNAFGPRAQQLLKNPHAPKTTNVANGKDPNDIIGPSGYGDSNWIASQQVLPYTIRFENDAEEATAAAQQVVITQTLDEDLDLSTFELTGFGFGETTHYIAAGLSDYETQIDLSDTHDVVVDVDIDLDVASRLVTWTFTSLDPTTLQPTKDPLAGFLPPNETSPEGEGWVAYRIESDSASASGTTIDAQAQIVFDVNDPIDTNLWTNTIDAAAPTSQVTELPGDGLGSSVLVSWSGSDEDGNGSGIAAYDIYISKDDGPYSLWLAGTQDTSATFSGSGISTYCFYSVAIDNVGNREAAPETVDAEATFLDQWFTGTAGDDTFEFIAAATNDAWIVRLNDVIQTVDSRAIGVYFDGLGGNDTVTFIGTEADDVAELHPTSAILSADAYTATGVNVETVTVIGAGGFDVASLYDSAGDDTLDMHPDVTLFSGDGFAQTVSDFSVVHVYAKSGGTDIASMYDSAGDDTFKADPQYAKLYGDGFYNRAKFFEVVHAYAKAGGNDTARLYDSAWNDRLVATPEFAKIYNSRYYRRAKFFETSIVYANAGGTDVARLYDSKGSDRLVATPYETRLYNTAGTYQVTARRFDAALVYATGGSDIARFYDSAGDDRLVTTPSQVRLNDTAGTYDVTALRFDAAVVYGSGGTDTAELYGRAGAIDVFRGRSNKSTYYGAGYDYTIRDFETVSAYGNQDERDVAKLHDTAGDDHLTASGNQATLARSDGSRTLYHVLDFPTVRAYSTTGTDTTEIEAAVDFLMLEGGWQD